MSQNVPCLPVSRRRKHPSNDITFNEDFTSILPRQEEIRISDVAQSMDAMQYLAMVHEQAQGLPDTFVISQESIHQQQPHNQSSSSFVPIEGSAASMEYLLSHRMELIRPPTRAHLPLYYKRSSSMETNTAAGTVVIADEQEQRASIQKWIQVTMSDFSNLRQYLSQCRDAGLGTNHWDYTTFTTTGQQEGSESNTPTINHTCERIPVPARKDRSGWHVFCLGKDEAKGNIGGYFDDSDNEEEDEEEESTEADQESDVEGNMFELNNHTTKKEIEEEVVKLQSVWDAKTVPTKGHRPTTRLICQFDQVLTRRVLSHHVHYLCQGWTLTPSRGLWIYALLSRLEKPLHRDDASCLRTLLRELCRLRAQVIVPSAITGGDFIPEETLLSTFNVLITIIGFYFEQSGEADGIMQSTACNTYNK